VDSQVRGEHDGPTIGLLLCKRIGHGFAASSPRMAAMGRSVRWIVTTS
jgi:hypothetical protein